MPAVLFVCTGNICRSPTAEGVFRAVVEENGMTVVGQFFPEDYEKKAIVQARHELRELSTAHVPAGVEVLHIVAYGTIYQEILNAAKSVNADLIVIASHRPEFKDYLIGPNAARVVRHARRPSAI